MRPPLLRFLCVTGVFLATAIQAAEDNPEWLETIRKERNVPALAAAAVQDGKILTAGAVGLRHLGGKNKVTVDDLWHIGSNTKSMTASVAAMLVERGDLKWEQTIGEALANRCPGMDPAWKNVTLDQLFRHRAGAPSLAPPKLWAQASEQKGSPSNQRWAFVRGLLSTPPENPPGTKFAYSNQGYSIAGQMMELAGKKPWEEMIRELLFKPLELRSAGFGAAGDPRRDDQPWGHRGDVPVAPGPGADNPAAIGPAGIVHLSIKDFARYAGWHAQQQNHLSLASFAKLHTPLPGQEYAMGWIVTQRPWGNGTVLMHNGTNTMNYAVMWVAPERKFAVVAATNSAGPAAERACDDACAKLIQQFPSKQ